MKAGILATLALAGTMHSAQAGILEDSYKAVDQVRTLAAERNLQGAQPTEEQMKVLYDCAGAYNSRNYFRCIVTTAGNSGAGTTPVGIPTSIVDGEGNFVVSKENCETAFANKGFTCLQYIDPTSTPQFFLDMLKADFGGKSACQPLLDLAKETGQTTPDPSTTASIENSQNEVKELEDALGKVKTFATECDKVVPNVSQQQYQAVPENSSSSFGVSVLLSFAAFVGFRGN